MNHHLIIADKDADVAQLRYSTAPLVFPRWFQKHNESLKYFDDALAINPEIKEAQVFKGMALYFLGRYDEALAIEAFKIEFMERFKSEIDQRQQ